MMAIALKKQTKKHVGANGKNNDCLFGDGGGGEKNEKSGKYYEQ